jgi:hypothetical protein
MGNSLGRTCPSLSDTELSDTEFSDWELSDPVAGTQWVVGGRWVGHDARAQPTGERAPLGDDPCTA